MRFFAKSPRSVAGTLRRVLSGFLLAFAAAPLAGAQAKPPAPKPAPDTILFANGDHLTGSLEHGVGTSVVFKSDTAGEITVPLAKIKELRSNEGFAVLRKGPPGHQIVVRGTILYNDGKLVVSNPNGPSETIPTDQIAYIIDLPTYTKDLERRPGPFYGWNGAVNGGATIVRATDYGETYTAGIALVRAIPTVPYLPPANRTTFGLQETYGKLTSPVIPQTTPPTPAAVTLTSIFHTAAERDEYFSSQFYALAQTTFDHNYSQGLQLQQVYGGGIGWTAIKSGKQELDVKASVQYEKQAYLTSSGTPNQNLIGSTISEAYHRNLPHKLVFTEAFGVLPAWNEPSDYSANGSVGLALPVFKRLSLTVTTTDNFLNDPAAGYNKNSFQFVTAVAYSLK